MQLERDSIEFVDQVITPPGGGTARRMQGVSVGGLKRQLDKCPQDAVVLIAFMIPTGETVYAPVRGLVDGDETGASVVLFDPMIEKAIRAGSGHRA
jgi:hypothetical protein